MKNSKKNLGWALSLLLSMTVWATACGDKKTQAVLQNSAPVSIVAGAPIARINGQDITDEDVRKVAGAKLAQAEVELYEARKSGLDDIIEGKLLQGEAEKQGVPKDELLKKAVYDKIRIEDKEIEKFYNEKKAQLGNKSLEEAKSNVRGFLFQQQYQKLYGELIKGLKKRSDVQILIKAPKLEVPEGDSPSIGPKDALVHIVEFTDYQCPFCGRVRSTVNQVLEEYKGKVRYVLRDFPLSFHKDSMKAHESALCAGEQNKYWDMNKKLFANQKDIQVEDLKKYAQELKLNMSKFNECLESGKFTALVQKNQSDGEKLGVTGTPAFFINGRMISGARPFESFKEIIDDELSSKE